MELLSPGPPITILEDVVYALPSSNVFISSVDPIEYSVDNDTWAALENADTTGVFAPGAYIRCTTGDTTVVCKASPFSNSNFLHQRRILVTHPEIIAWPTTPILVAPATPTQLIIPHMAIIKSTIIAPYTNISPVGDGVFIFRSVGGQNLSEVGNIEPYLDPALGPPFNGEWLGYFKFADVLYDAGYGSMFAITQNYTSAFVGASSSGIELTAFNPLGDFTDGDANNTVEILIVYSVYDIESHQFVAAN